MYTYVHRDTHAWIIMCDDTMIYNVLTCEDFSVCCNGWTKKHSFSTRTCGTSEPEAKVKSQDIHHWIIGPLDQWI